MDSRQFVDPEPRYRGVTLWMLNDELEPGEIERQLRGFRAAGWGAVITRTFVGLRTRYLSPQWMDITERIIEVADELDMKVWLQAGYMPSGMPELPPGRQHRVLVRKPAEETAETSDKLLLRRGDWAYYARSREHVLDLLNREAVESYLQSAYEETWSERFGEHFGRTVEAVWVDEPHFRPPLLPWSDELPGRFRRRWGYRLLDSLPALYGEEGDFQRVRHHYWRTVLEMFLEAYFEPVGRWCREHDLKFSGHLMGEDTLMAQIGFTGAAMPCYPQMQLPGIDHLTGSLEWPSGKPFIATPKQCSSAAHQAGRPEVLAEMYGVSTQGLTFADRKRIAEWLAVLGINYRCFHGSFYSLRGRRKRVYVPHLSHQQPWWRHNRLIADYFARLSWALRQGRYRADVLVLHPVESGFCLYDPTTVENPHDRRHEPDRIQDLDDSLVRLSGNLMKIHRGFDYGDETILARRGEAGDGRLRVGEMSYRAVVLPSMLTLRETTAELLEDFLDAGGAVLATGQTAGRIEGVPDQRAATLARRFRPVANEPEELEAALQEAVPPDLRLETAEADAAQRVWVHERELETGHLIYLVNVSDESLRATLRVRGEGAWQEWDLKAGETRPRNCRREEGWTTTPLHLAPHGARLLLFRPGEVARESTPARPAVRRTHRLDGPWQIQRRDPNALTLDFCRFRRGEGDWSRPLPVIAVQEVLEREEYEGPVHLRFTFQAEVLPPDLRLVLEDAGQYAIRVNGEPAACDGLPHYVDRSFHPVDVADLVREGENTVELSRRFEPPDQAAFGLARLFEEATGAELESIYLIGDFAVKANPAGGREAADCVWLTTPFRLGEEPEQTQGDLAAGGYPFFAGRMTLSLNIDLQMPGEGERVFLTLPGLDAVFADLRVNGQDCGAVAWPPYRTEITPAVTAGSNRVEVELVNSLRNLLGPHHRPEGEVPDTWRHHFSALAFSGPDWHQRRDEPEVPWTDDYCFVRFGLPQGATVEYVEAPAES